MYSIYLETVIHIICHHFLHLVEQHLVVTVIGAGNPHIISKLPLFKSHLSHKEQLYEVETRDWVEAEGKHHK